MREHEHHLQFHQRGEPNRRPRVVGKAQEARSIRDETAVQRDTVKDRAHAVLANSEMWIAALELAALEISAVLDVGKGRLIEIGRAAEQVPYFFRNRGFGLRS